MKGDRCAFGILMGTPRGKKPLGRPRLRLEDTNRLGLKEICIWLMEPGGSLPQSQRLFNKSYPVLNQFNPS